MVPLVASVACRAVLEACRNRGVDVDRLIARVGIVRGDVYDPEARIPANVSDALWREAWLATGDPALALHAAETVRFGAYRVLDYLSTSGPTLGEGIGRLASYFPLIDPRGRVHLEPTPDRVSVIFASASGAPLPPGAQEYTLALLVLRARDASGAAWDPVEVNFAFAAPVDSTEHVRLLGPRVRFDAPRPEVVIARAVWDRPAPARDAGLFAILDAHARSLLAEGVGTGNRLAMVRQAIAADLPGKRPSLGSSARRLGMSRRSLQRSLEAQATSFAALVDEVRAERARALLAAPDVSLAEVSWLLGFSEQSAFARAFKRWTELSPSDYRRAKARRTLDGALPQ